jgi:hypothetical protein
MLDSSDPKANDSHRLIELRQTMNYSALKVICRIFILLSIVQTRIVDNKNIGIYSSQPRAAHNSLSCLEYERLFRTKRPFIWREVRCVRST